MHSCQIMPHHICQCRIGLELGAGVGFGLESVIVIRQSGSKLSEGVHYLAAVHLCAQHWLVSLLHFHTITVCSVSVSV